MKRPPVIVDTNVLVAGLLTNDDASPTAMVLDGMLDAAFTVVLSPALLAEYRQVLVRPSLCKQHGLSTGEVETLLFRIALHAVMLDTTRGPDAPDPGDQMLWNLLATRADLLLVTGDRRLLDDAGMRGRVVTPRQFHDPGAG